MERCRCMWFIRSDAGACSYCEPELNRVQRVHVASSIECVAWMSGCGIGCSKQQRCLDAEGLDAASSGCK
eukprot:36777-Pelagomonas_calceolata.AAC.3